MEKLINKCGGKSSGCAVEYELPKGVTPHKVTDNGGSQGEAGGKTKPKTRTR